VGKKISLALVEQISHLASDSVKTRSDSRASSEYRSHLVRVLVARSIAAAAEEAGFSLED
jgi:CO/xanthine dehydrogenase FAD-binding subunit